MWNATRSSRTAMYSFTGMFTSPKLMVPVQMGRGDGILHLFPLAASRMGGSPDSRIRKRQLLRTSVRFFHHFRRFLVRAQPLERGLLNLLACGPATIFDFRDQLGLQPQGVRLGHGLDERIPIARVLFHQTG